MDMIVTEEGRPSDDIPREDSDNAGISHAEEAPHPGTKFQKAIAAWRVIDFSTFVTKLDTTASEVAADQKDALIQRKELAQKTKDFRKLDDAGKLVEHKGLIKAYQTFIDLLTNQGKASSSAFFQLYSALSEAPDPYPLLEASVESLVLSEDTLPKLTRERDALRKSLQSVSSQLESAEKHVTEERAARSRLEQEQGERSKAIETRWAEVLQEKQENWESREKAMEEKVENVESLLREIKANHEVARRLDQDATVQPPWAGNATATEMEMVHADLEKTTTRLTDIEARNEQLRLELAQAISQSHPAKPHSVHEDPAYQILRSENSALLRRLDSARLDKDAEKHEVERKMLLAERQRGHMVSEVEDLRTRVAKMANYDELRRELDMIKTIEFGATDEDDSQAEVNGVNGAAEDVEKESLEQLLTVRNKKLSNDLTTLRVSHQSLQGQLEGLREELRRTNADFEKSQNLTAALENDILKIQGDGVNVNSPSGLSTVGSLRRPGSTRRGRASPTSSIISGFDTGSQTPSNALEALRTGGPVGGGSGMLPMVQAQRDRFKQKNTQLEEELSKIYATVTSLRAEVASLQKDNLNLYEKTRYVSTYNRGQLSTTSSSSAFSQGPNHTAIQMPASAPSPSLDRYKSQYEANISPFAAFRGRESTRAYTRMSLPERAIFSMTRIILANRMSRNLFAGYCVALHVLVLVMLYSNGTVSTAKQVESLGDATAGVAAAAAARVGSMGEDITSEESQTHEYYAA